MAELDTSKSTEIRTLQDVDTDEYFYPLTHEQAIIDENGEEVIPKIKECLGINKGIAYEKIEGYYISNNSGKIAQHKDYGYIKIDVSEMYGLSIVVKTNIGGAATWGIFDFSDKAIKFGSDYNDTVVPAEYEIVIPHGVSWIGVSYADEELLSVQYKDLISSIREVQNVTKDIINNMETRLNNISEMEVMWYDGGYIEPTNGLLVENNNYKYTDFISINDGRLCFSLYFTVKSFKNIAICVYDRFKKRIKTIRPESESLIEFSDTILGDSNSFYVRFSCYIDYVPKIFYVFKNLKISDFNFKPITNAEIKDKTISEEKLKIIKHNEETNFIKGFLAEKSYIKDGNIIFTENNELYATEKVFLKEGETYYWGGLYSGYSAFYDENDNIIEIYNFGEFRPNPFIAPTGTFYGRFTSQLGNSLENAWISLTNKKPLPYAIKLDENIQIPHIHDNATNPCDYAGDDISLFTKCICIGDSLTSGTMNADGSTEDGRKYVNIEKYSFPSNLERITGITTVNKGLGGLSSLEWFNNQKDTDLSGFDMAIIQLGVNDGIRYGEWGESSITGFTNIINKLKNECKNIKIFVSTIIPATSYSNDVFNEISNGIRNLVTSLNDQNVILVDLALYGHTKDSTAYNCGHLSAYGYFRLAKDYKSFISYYISTHKENFKEVQFIGTDYISGY